ncbi:carbohydrate kinase family protein [Alkalihalobacillus sp. 1P02AB]|uniref:carbohydrate kinase family protein n=1 Tax=Alkalihalobacillus sp. 1P02AB TaxID=3132260 RepID=UPI0039A59EC8
MNNHSMVICVGEMLIDFFCKDIGVSLEQGKSFEKQAGGAPANVCATIVKLGGEAGFSGKVGNDPFGHFLKRTLEDIKVDTSMMKLDPLNPTTLAFVSLMENGERDFVFNRGADRWMKSEDIDEKEMAQAKILHFGSATALLEEPFRSTYLNAIDRGYQNGQFISFDPNYRIDLWRGREREFVEWAKEGIKLADFVKVSDEELQIISEEKEMKVGVEKLHQMGAKLIAVTLGKEGTYISNGSEHSIIPSIFIQSIDSTGAGDAFVGATLLQFSKEVTPKEIISNFEKVKDIITFSNKVGALVCTKIGAIEGIPTYEEVLNFEMVK